MIEMIKIRYKEWIGTIKESSYQIINKERFDPKTMIEIKETEEEKKAAEKRFSDMLKSKSGPFVNTNSSSSNSTPSAFHNGKLDSGAVENLIDTGFDGAKKRIDERANKLGAPFIMKKNYALRRKKR